MTDENAAACPSPNQKSFKPVTTAAFGLFPGNIVIHPTTTTHLSSLIMANLITHRINLAPTARALSSGVPRSAVNFRVSGVAGGHGSGHADDEHGAAGPRKDMIPGWSWKSDGVLQRSRLNGG